MGYGTSGDKNPVRPRVEIPILAAPDSNRSSNPIFSSTSVRKWSPSSHSGTVSAGTLGKQTLSPTRTPASFERSWFIQNPEIEGHGKTAWFPLRLGDRTHYPKIVRNNGNK